MAILLHASRFVRCLLELLESAREGVPVLPITVAGSKFDVEAMRGHISNLDLEIGQEGLKLLRRHCDEDDLGDLKCAVHEVLDQLADESARLEWNPHASDEAMKANLKDIAEHMAAITRRKKLKWREEKDMFAHA